MCRELKDLKASVDKQIPFATASSLELFNVAQKEKVENEKLSRTLSNKEKDMQERMVKLQEKVLEMQEKNKLLWRMEKEMQNKDKDIEVKTYLLQEKDKLIQELQRSIKVKDDLIGCHRKVLVFSV